MSPNIIDKNSGTRFAPLLAYIGAMRFLRAQAITGNFIVYSIPVASRFILNAESARSLSWVRDDEEPEQALALLLLDLAINGSGCDAQWKGLSYQVLQAQAGQQSISRSRGSLNLGWFERLRTSSRAYLLRHWQRLLRTPKKESPIELHHLVEMLITSTIQEWEEHLFDVARAELAQKPRTDQDDQVNQIRLYSMYEIQEVSTFMEPSIPTPLSAVLASKEGTMRFGHALRQLRAYKPPLARELLDDMESTRTREQLMDILTRAMQTCELLESKSPFLIIPSDQDFQLLLKDIDSYSAPTIASLLRLLSTLHYPSRKGETDQSEETQTPAAPTMPETAVSSESMP